MYTFNDLWFQGFITQKGTGKDKEMGWNEEKYWSLLHAPKDKDNVRKVEIEAKNFIALIKSQLSQYVNKN